MARGPAWTHTEKAFLRCWYGLMPTRRLARYLRRSTPAVVHMAHRLGLGWRREGFRGKKVYQ